MDAEGLLRGTGMSRTAYALPADTIRYNLIYVASSFSVILITRLVCFLFCLMEEVFPQNEALLSAFRGIKTEAKHLPKHK